MPFGLALAHQRLGRQPLRLALTHQALRGAHGDACAFQIGLRLPALRLQHRDIHLGQHCARLDEIALVDADRQNPPWRLGGHVDFHAFDAAVARSETHRQWGRLQPPPPQHAPDDHDRKEDHPDDFV